MRMRRSPARIPAAVLTGMILGGCAGGTPPPHAAAGAAADSTAALEALYRARLERARERFTEADVRFMTRMIGHHGQALEMAELAPARSEDPEILTLARRIHAAQVDEIEAMRRWLRDRGQPVPAPDAGHAHLGPMPGMVPEERMSELRGARGPAFDRLFLTLMIGHHEGAVTMVRELFATDGAGQDEEVFKFASDAQVDQITEIERMERMLAARSLR